MGVAGGGAKGWAVVCLWVGQIWGKGVVRIKWVWPQIRDVIASVWAWPLPNGWGITI